MRSTKLKQYLILSELSNKNVIDVQHMKVEVLTNLAELAPQSLLTLLGYWLLQVSCILPPSIGHMKSLVQTHQRLSLKIKEYIYYQVTNNKYV